MIEPPSGSFDASFSRYMDARRAFLRSGRSLSMFDAIVLSCQPSNAIERLAGESPDVDSVVADYYESFKATAEE